MPSRRFHSSFPLPCDGGVANGGVAAVGRGCVPAACHAASPAEFGSPNIGMTPASVATEPIPSAASVPAVVFGAAGISPK